MIEGLLVKFRGDIDPQYSSFTHQSPSVVNVLSLEITLYTRPQAQSFLNKATLNFAGAC